VCVQTSNHCPWHNARSSPDALDYPLEWIEATTCTLEREEYCYNAAVVAEPEGGEGRGERGEFP
jgi:hypothetical protein